MDFLGSGSWQQWNFAITQQFQFHVCRVTTLGSLQRFKETEVFSGWRTRRNRRTIESAVDNYGPECTLLHRWFICPSTLRLTQFVGPIRSSATVLMAHATAGSWGGNKVAIVFNLHLLGLKADGIGLVLITDWITYVCFDYTSVCVRTNTFSMLR